MYGRNRGFSPSAMAGGTFLWSLRLASAISASGSAGGMAAHLMHGTLSVIVGLVVTPQQFHSGTQFTPKMSWWATGAYSITTGRMCIVMPFSVHSTVISLASTAFGCILLG